MNVFTWAIIIQILLLIYFEVTTLVNLFPWNDLSKYSTREKVIEATASGIIILLGIILFATKIKWLMILSVGLWFVHLLMQLFTWWMPYVTGKHLTQFPKSLYDTHFQKTVKI